MISCGSPSRSAGLGYLAPAIQRVAGWPFDAVVSDATQIDRVRRNDGRDPT
jgi:hypothetical protein